MQIAQTLYFRGLTIATAVLVGACGGGDGGPSANADALTCDQTAEALKVPRAPAIAPPIHYTLPPNYVTASPTYDRWKMTIGGMQNELNVAISRPANEASIVGIVIDAHGHAQWQETATPQMMMFDTFLHSQYVSRGYIAVTVARRGNFGSTGDRLSSSSDYGETTKYQ